MLNMSGFGKELKIPLMDRYVNEAPSEVNPVEQGNAYHDQVICRIGG